MKKKSIYLREPNNFTKYLEMERDDNMDSKNYTFDFTIPQGPTGPTGPQGRDGLSYGLDAYIERYNTTPSVINLTANVESQVPLLDMVSPRKATYKEPSSMVLETDGVFEINYFLNISVTKPASVTVAIREDGRIIAPTRVTKNLPAGFSSMYTGNLIYTLGNDSVIDMVILSPSAVQVTLESGTNAGLTLKKLN